jgi:hypothetical protein
VALISSAIPIASLITDNSSGTIISGISLILLYSMLIAIMSAYSTFMQPIGFIIINYFHHEYVFFRINQSVLLAFLKIYIYT